MSIEWITSQVKKFPYKFTNLIMDCKSLLTRDWEVHSSHLWREANDCVDLLAKRGVSNTSISTMIHRGGKIGHDP